VRVDEGTGEPIYEIEQAGKDAGTTTDPDGREERHYTHGKPYRKVIRAREIAVMR